MDDEHSGVGSGFGNNIAEITCALLGRRPGPQGLPDGEDIIVHRLRQTDDGEPVIVPRQKGREIGRGSVGVIAPNGVKNVNAILHQLIRRDFLRILPFGHQATFDAILNVRQLDPAVADG